MCVLHEKCFSDLKNPLGRKLVLRGEKEFFRNQRVSLGQVKESEKILQFLEAHVE